jgi:hypothetical protein
MHRPRTSLAATAAILLLLAGCIDTTAVNESIPSRYSLTSGTTLIECPVDETRSTTARLGPLGGILALDGHALSLPAGAILEPTEFTLTVPAGRHVEINVKANGQEGFGFLEPVALVISYERCHSSDFRNNKLGIYKIDPGNKKLLKAMAIREEKTLRRVIAVSDSLSGYAIAQ